MPDDQPKADEIIVRVIKRNASEMIGEHARPNMDENDFRRRSHYPKIDDPPENGLSLLRKSKFESTNDIYAGFPAKKLLGLSECLFKQLTDKGLKPLIDGDRYQHISLRCADCDMAVRSGTNGVCKPKGAKETEECPFFGRDPSELSKLFTETAKPAQRASARRK